MTDARRVAFDVLVRVERGAFADRALGKALERATLSGEDRGLATHLVYGVLARQLRLDHTIEAYAHRPAIDARIRIALHLALFQLAFLDRVPEYAAVDTAVELVRSFAPHAAGFANALLRRAAREGLAEPPADEPRRTAVELSHPMWLVDMWQRELGETEARALMEADNQPMPNVLRALVPRESAIGLLRERGVEAQAARFAPDAIVAAAPYVLPGVTIPQGQASQLVALLLGARSGQRVLDACAAPGGKAAYLAALIGTSGQVVAVDPAPSARERIAATCAATGVGNVEIIARAIEDAGDLGAFDGVLVDAPCSGLGTLREHPEIRWRRTPADIEQLARRQRSILAAAAARVRPGGVLVYATCTISEAENDTVVDEFLAAGGGFHQDAGSVNAALVPLLDAHGRLRTFPHRHDMSGFFAVRLRRGA